VTFVSVTGISCPSNLERTRLFIGVPLFKFPLIRTKFWAKTDVEKNKIIEKMALIL
jgi:hypothetical protein